MSLSRRDLDLDLEEEEAEEQRTQLSSPTDLRGLSETRRALSERLPLIDPFATIRTTPLPLKLLTGHPKDFPRISLDQPPLSIHEEVFAIGGGNSGHILELPATNLVLKAFYSPRIFAQTVYEYRLHETVYNLFEEAKSHISKLKSSTFNLLVSRTRVALADAISPDTLLNNGNRYSTFFRMGRQFGVDLSTIEQFEATRSDLLATSQTMKERTEHSYYDLEDDLKPLVHLTFNNAGSRSGLLGVNVEQKVSKTNPPQGYFLHRNTAQAFIDQQMRAQGLGDAYNIDAFKWLLGFCHGLLYWNGILPFDLEIAFGDHPTYDNDFLINLMDFGNFLDLNVPAYPGDRAIHQQILNQILILQQDHHISRHRAVEQLLNNPDFERMILEDIAKGPLVDPRELKAKEGWEYAKAVAIQLKRTL